MNTTVYTTAANIRPGDVLVHHDLNSRVFRYHMSAPKVGRKWIILYDNVGHRLGQLLPTDAVILEREVVHSYLGCGEGSDGKPCTPAYLCPACVDAVLAEVGN